MNGLRAACPSIGFFGKIPSRGDFLHSGLSLGFTQAWDRWLQRVLVDGRRLLGEAWPELWVVAPVWRFALPSGQCGRHPVLGLWMPSIDQVGRPFPLTFAAEGADRGDAFLDAAEQIGREAIAYDLAPDTVMSRLRRALPPEPAPAVPGSRTRWWSTGGPFAAAAELVLDGLPDGAGFAGMLRR